MKRSIAVLVAMIVAAEAFAQPVAPQRWFGKTAAAARAPLTLVLPSAMAVRSAVPGLSAPALAPATTPSLAPTRALSALPQALPQVAEAAPASGPAAIMEASAGPGTLETLRARGQESFDGAVSAAAETPTAMASPVARKSLRGRLLKSAALAVPLFLASAGYASAKTIGVPAAPSLPQLAANHPAFAAAANAGYYIGNALGLVVDIPRMFSAVRSKNPVALSLSSTAILMAASLVAGVKGFLGGDLFWAWQNVFCGVMPMAVALLANAKTRRIFPEGPGTDKEYSLPVALKRLGVLCLAGGIPALILSLLGTFILVPLGAAGASAMVQLILQAVACAGFAACLVPQIVQIKKVKSIEGVSVWFMRVLTAMYAAFSLWITRAVFLQIGPDLGQTLANPDFWKHAIYALQIFVSLYLVRLTLRVMAKNK